MQEPHIRPIWEHVLSDCKSCRMLMMDYKVEQLLKDEWNMPVREKDPSAIKCGSNVVIKSAAMEKSISCFYQLLVEMGVSSCDNIKARLIGKQIGSNQDLLEAIIKELIEIKLN